jgi:uncharacterized protein
MNPDLAKGRRFLAAHGAGGRILAGVTGAHYYGLPSPDSDLDLKGIHVAPTSEVVGLKPVRDSVDYLGDFEGLEIDYTSHELAVALRLLLRGNGNILERILTPFQALESAEAVELQGLARAAASRRFFHHYRGFFKRVREDWRRARPQTVKGLLYSYRSALTGIHLLRTGECVGDVTRLAPLYGFDRVADLAARKARGSEHGEWQPGDSVEPDLERLDALLDRAFAESALPDEATNADALNDFLVRCRQTHW